ncbi:MAG: GGDEF domain-containing protein [Oscillospiraceae bacterium]|nr:GGDEF domain-containing protein [Oscillospiraceae bacterium]
MKRIRKPLKQSVLQGCILLIAVLCLVLSLLNYWNDRRMQYSHYESYIENILRYTASGIDTDDLAACIRSGQVSEGYRALQGFLDGIKDNLELHFLYIIIPLSDEPVDNIRNVIAAMSREEYETIPDQLVQLGDLTGDSYSPETARKYLRAYESGQLSFFEEVSEWGDDYTGLLPLYDSDGNKIAALCMDVDIQEIHSSLRAQTFTTVGVTLALGVLFTLLFILWADANITRPIEKLEAAVADFAASSHRHDDPEALVLRVPELRTGNEVESLSDAVLKMSQDMRDSVQKMLSTQMELARLNTLAHKDGLTHVGNKVAYTNYAKDLLHKMQTQTLEYAIIMADCNHLKRMNDSYGHEKGDSYLKASCALLCNIFHHSPVFRVGGDEFVIVLTGRDYANREELLGRAADEMRKTEENPSAAPWEKISIAIGVALYRPGEDKTVEDVYVRADQAMYAEKVRMNAVRT